MWMEASPVPTVKVLHPCSTSWPAVPLTDNACFNRVTTGAALGGALGASIGERPWCVDQAAWRFLVCSRATQTSCCHPTSPFQAHCTAPLRPFGIASRACRRSGTLARPPPAVPR